MEESSEKKVIDKTTESINKIIDEGLNTNNLDNLLKLSKIKHMAKEDENMYGEYGNYSGGRGSGRRSYGEYGNYGEYGEYGARGRGRRYRGDDYMDRMREEYGRYQESRQRYGAGEETDKSFYYMVEAYKDFGKVLFEEAETPQQKQMLREAMQQSMM